MLSIQKKSKKNFIAVLKKILKIKKIKSKKIKSKKYKKF